MHKTKPINFLTLDVEEWYEAEFIQEVGGCPDGSKYSLLEDQVDLFIDLCANWGVKATCFVTGEVGLRYPEVVKKLACQGHEIASHSLRHKLVYNMDPQSFRSDLWESVRLLEDLTGQKVFGFRAPSLSVNKAVSGWFYEALENEGIIYSSSVYPAKNFLYGYPEAAPDIHIVPGQRIVEMPQQLWNLGFAKIGFAGGAYLRLLPAWLVNHLIQTKNAEGKPVFIYAHPWELIAKQYPVRLSLAKHMIQNWGIKWNAAKLDRIIGKNQDSFVRMADHARSQVTKAQAGAGGER